MPPNRVLRNLLERSLLVLNLTHNGRILNLTADKRHLLLKIFMPLLRAWSLGSIAPAASDFVFASYY